MREKNSAAAGTYFSNLSLLLFLGGEVIVASGSRKVFAICAMLAQEQRVSRHCTLAGVVPPFHLGLRLFPFLEKIILEKWHFYRLAPKLRRATWCKQHSGTNHAFITLQVKGWYWDRKTSAKWDSSIWSVYYRHQKENGGVHEFSVSDLLFHLFFDVLFTTIWFPMVKGGVLVCSDTISRMQPGKRSLFCAEWAGHPLLRCSQHL